MRSIVFRGILAATAVFAAACSSIDSVAPTTSPATARRDASAGPNGTSVSRPIDQNVWVSCANGGAGEAVRVTGELHFEVHSTKDSSGVFHLNFKSATSCDAIPIASTEIL